MPVHCRNLAVRAFQYMLLQVPIVQRVGYYVKIYREVVMKEQPHWLTVLSVHRQPRNARCLFSFIDVTDVNKLQQWRSQPDNLVMLCKF